MKKELSLLLLILSHTLMSMKGQATSTVITNRMNFGADYITGGCADSTGSGISANTFMSSYTTWYTIIYALRHNPFANLGTMTSVTAGTGLNGGVITTTGTISMPNTGTPSTYEKVTTDAQGRVSIGYNSTIYDSVIRSLNASFVISTTKDAFICYSIKISVSISLALGVSSSGRVTPQHKSPGGSYWINMPYVENAPTLSGLGILTVGLLQSSVYQFNSTIPAGDSVKFTTSTTGTSGNVVFTLLYGQEKY